MSAVFIGAEMNGISFVVLLLDHVMTAFGTLFIDRLIPADKITFRIAFTPVKPTVFSACFFKEPLSA